MVESRHGEGRTPQPFGCFCADGARGLAGPDDALRKQIPDELGCRNPGRVGEHVVQAGAGHKRSLDDLVTAHRVDDPIGNAKVSGGP